MNLLSGYQLDYLVRSLRADTNQVLCILDGLASLVASLSALYGCRLIQIKLLRQIINF